MRRPLSPRHLSAAALRRGRDLGKARDAYPAKVFLPAGFCVVQRFGSAFQLAPHFHVSLFDGAYRKDDRGSLHFVAARAMSPAERLTLVTRIASRVERLLERRGLRQSRDDGPTQLELLAMQVPASAPVQGAAPNASSVRGFNLHASTRISASDERGRLLLFATYCARPSPKIASASTVSAGRSR